MVLEGASTVTVAPIVALVLLVPTLVSAVETPGPTDDVISDDVPTHKTMIL